MDTQTRINFRYTYITYIFSYKIKRPSLQNTFLEMRFIYETLRPADTWRLFLVPLRIQNHRADMDETSQQKVCQYKTILFGKL
jgi:hypothetical protein